MNFKSISSSKTIKNIDDCNCQSDDFSFVDFNKNIKYLQQISIMPCWLLKCHRVHKRGRVGRKLSEKRWFFPVWETIDLPLIQFCFYCREKIWNLNDKINDKRMLLLVGGVAKSQLATFNESSLEIKKRETQIKQQKTWWNKKSTIIATKLSAAIFKSLSRHLNLEVFHLSPIAEFAFINI